jgi:transcriptional regulator with XRE-family HTH domain
MDYSRIKELCDRQRVPIKELAAKCNITEAGLYQMLRNQSMKIDILEKIAEVLRVPINAFFEAELAKKGTPSEALEPFNTDGAQNLLALNIPPEEKIKLLVEMLELLRLTTEAQKKVIAAHEAEIQRLKQH